MYHIPYVYTVEVTNRFKGSDLVDRVPEELGMEVHNTVQEAVTKTIPKKRNARRQRKRLSEEALQIAEKKREAKGKGQREKHTQLRAEFQKIARRDKKALLSEQCKVNYRMGKTREHFKKIGDTEGTLYPKTGTISEE